MKSGNRVIIEPYPADDARNYREWKGIRGTVGQYDGSLPEYVRVEIDSRPLGWGYDFVICKKSWLKPSKPLSPLEEAIAAYVKSEMAQLGVS